MKICYLGISSPEFSRNGVYIPALRETGAEVVECFDTSPGLAKYVALWKKHKKVGQYDVLIVGYPGHAIMWFARLISRKPIIFDAAASFYEAEIVSRNPEKRISIFALRLWLMDEIACRLATRILVESNAQAAYFKKLFKISSNKLVTVYTGADEHIFSAQNDRELENSSYQVVFRGRLLPEAGVRHVVDAAKLLQQENIHIRIIGFGLLQPEVELQIERLKLANLKLDSQVYKRLEDLVEQMRGASVSLGQLELHERLERTIPHKAYESMAMKIPYITARAAGIAELLTDGESCIMVRPADPRDLAEKILYLKKNPKIAKEIAERAYIVFSERASQKILGKQLLTLCEELAGKC